MHRSQVDHFTADRHRCDSACNVTVPGDILRSVGDLSGKQSDDEHPALAEGKRVLSVESAALAELVEKLDQSFVDAVDLILSCQQRVVTMGMGKSGLICRKITATLASTGTPSFFMHPAEAIHGDLGMIVSGDVVLALSNSGETEEMVRLIESIRRIGARMISITGRPDSTLARNSDVHINAAISREACPLGLAPTTSTTVSLALGDALAMALLVSKGFREEDFAFFHPGGKLGKKFLRVADLMHTGDDIPVVSPETSMRDVIYEMSSKGFGITAVAEQGALVGVISDGDLRRLLQEDEAMISQTASSSMTTEPITIVRDELASAALQIMEERRITSLFVTDQKGAIEGIVHLHDLWGLELF